VERRFWAYGRVLPVGGRHDVPSSYEIQIGSVLNCADAADTIFCAGFGCPNIASLMTGKVSSERIRKI